VRIERVVLEDHRDIAVLRRHVVDEAIADEDVAAGLFLEPGDHAERGRLATAGGTDEHEELFVPDLDVEVVDRRHFAELLHDVVHVDCGHG
jgi:hypothetical protein